MRIELFFLCLLVVVVVYAMTDGFEPAEAPARPMAPANLEVGDVRACPDVANITDTGICSYNADGTINAYRMDGGWVTVE